MSKANRDIKELTPQFQTKVNAFLKEVWDEIFITEWYRTQKRQNELYAQWRTAPWNIVTWTLNSDHTKRTAIDIAFKWPDLYPREHSRWVKISEIAKKYNIKWMYPEWWIDKPHFVDDWIPYRKEYPIWKDWYYKGYIVWTEPHMCSDNATACVYSWFQKIFLKPKFWEIDNEKQQESVLEHEYAHIIYNFAEREDDRYIKLWKLVSEWDKRVMDRINKLLWTNYTENAWVAEYAKKNDKEDFAETIQVDFLRNSYWVDEKFDNWADVKIIIAKAILKKFWRDWNGKIKW